MIERISPTIHQVLVKMNRVLLLGLVVAVAAAPVLFLNQTATAAQITTRSILISNPHTSTASNYTFTFTVPTNDFIRSMKFQACNVAIGPCVSGTSTPVGINMVGSSISTSGFTDSASWGSPDTVTPGCATTPDILCLTRSSTIKQTAATTVTVTDNGATNPAGSSCGALVQNCTFFIRITTFNNTAYTSPANVVDAGTVAASTTQRFTVNAAIEEALTFCIGATNIDDLLITSTPAPCASISGTSLSLGVLNPANVSVSPVDAPVDLGDANNGIAELSTNAFHGVAVSYASVQDSGGTGQKGTLKVPGAGCVGITQINTDQCINALNAGSATITHGIEHFGMTIAGVNCRATAAYPCDFAFGTNNLVPVTAYNGAQTNTYPNVPGTNTYLGDTNQISTVTTGKYAWDDTGAYNNIATSATVVDKEALILKFAATPNAITPTGSYLTSADFVATPVY